MSRRHNARAFRAVLAAALLAAAVAAAPSVAAGDSGPEEKLPRFVSLRSDQVNLRVGPGGNYPIRWVLTRKDMPVEILKVFEHWRMIRDWQGAEGWVHERMLTAKRGVVVQGGVRALRRRPDPGSQIVARAEAGVVARLDECQGGWCRIAAGDIAGWVQRADLWGVYPDETVQ